jgi:hypothetical protein
MGHKHVTPTLALKWSELTREMMGNELQIMASKYNNIRNGKTNDIPLALKLKKKILETGNMTGNICLTCKEPRTIFCMHSDTRGVYE